MRERAVEVAAQLDRLDAWPEPAVLRFDSGGPLAGRVAVLPSAFNPPTVAHLRLLTVAAAQDGQPAALLTTRNVAKDVHGASLADRVGMLLAARAELGPMAVLVTNAARFVDQAAALRSNFTAVRFDFVAGYDTLVRIFDRRYYADMEGELWPFFHHHRLIVTNRGEVATDDVTAYLSRVEVRQFAHRIVVEALDEAAAAMSSTAARAAIMAEMDPSPISSSVAGYIQTHGLYRAHEGPVSKNNGP